MSLPAIHYESPVIYVAKICAIIHCQPYGVRNLNYGLTVSQSSLPLNRIGNSISYSQETVA